MHFEALLAQECMRTSSGAVFKVLLDHSVVLCHRHIIQAQFNVMLDTPVDAFHWLLRFQVQFIKVLMDLSWIMPVLSF